MASTSRGEWRSANGAVSIERARAEATDAAERLGSRFAWRAAAGRVAVVVIYAIGMAYVESAAVLYLRTIYGGIDPVGPRHSPFDPLPDFEWVEFGREAATMLMLASVGWLAGRGSIGRVGAFALAMGVWDIGYYLFLWLFAGWPASLLAPDILFLIPLPWWGPVLAPVLSASVMAVAGAVALARESGDGIPRLRARSWLPILAGIGLCLAAFMADALETLPRGGYAAAIMVRGGTFPWPIFGLGVVLAIIGLVDGLGRSHGPVAGPYLRPRFPSSRQG